MEAPVGRETQRAVEGDSQRNGMTRMGMDLLEVEEWLPQDEQVTFVNLLECTTSSTGVPRVAPEDSLGGKCAVSQARVGPGGACHQRK